VTTWVSEKTLSDVWFGLKFGSAVGTEVCLVSALPSHPRRISAKGGYPFFADLELEALIY
jgi:hypothetical protein